MKPTIDVILQSLNELSKRKVKRYAKVWSSKISDLLSIRNQITKDNLAEISKHFLNNNLLNNQDVQYILRDNIKKVSNISNFSLKDYSILSYVYSCIGEDGLSEHILSNNYSKCALKSYSDDDLLLFLKTISLSLSRQVWGNTRPGSTVIFDISKDFNSLIWEKIYSVTGNMSEMVEYMKFSEVLLESIFISNLIGKLDTDVLNSDLIDYGSIFSMIKVSEFLSSDRKDGIINKIYHSDYNTVLDILRNLSYFKLPNFEFTEHIFNRLCNTTAKSSMCRRECLGYLDQTLRDIESRVIRKEGDIHRLSTLYSNLKAIKSSNVLENPHRSRIRWNYPVFIN